MIRFKLRSERLLSASFWWVIFPTTLLASIKRNLWSNKNNEINIVRGTCSHSLNSYCRREQNKVFYSFWDWRNVRMPTSFTLRRISVDENNQPWGPSKRILVLKTNPLTSRRTWRIMTNHDRPEKRPSGIHFCIASSIENVGEQQQNLASITTLFREKPRCDAFIFFWSARVHL